MSDIATLKEANRAANAIIAQQAGEMAVLQKTLNEAKAKRLEQFNVSIRIMTQMDDLAETMAMALEDLLVPEGPGDMDPVSVTHDNMLCDAKVAAATEAVKAWRAVRPTRGLVRGWAR